MCLPNNKLKDNFITSSQTDKNYIHALKSIWFHLNLQVWVISLNVALQYFLAICRVYMLGGKQGGF